MWPCNASGVSDQSDDLSALNRLANANQRFAQVKVRRNDSAAVVDINHVARQEEVVD
jgi:hypothetical protein